MIDAHIHLDQYINEETILDMLDSSQVKTVVTVSNNLESCRKNQQLSKKFSKVKPAFGYHPEQPLPSEADLAELISWMTGNRSEMIAIGEVGLPYYRRLEQKVSVKEYSQYCELLDIFVRLASKWNLPVALHAVYDDAPVVCDLLEKHSIQKAHFHWFKGDVKTLERMAENGYFISVTPEVVYREKIQRMVKQYPLDKLMVETDGPWPFEGPFKCKMTLPHMMGDSIKTIGKLLNIPSKDIEEKLDENTRYFYGL